MQGGGSGKVIEPGDADNSTLFLVVSHKEEPKMPPNSAKIPDAEIELIRKWIEGGALENSGSVAAAKAKPKFEFKLDPAAMGKPAGTPAMPENVSTEPFVPQARAERRRGDGGQPLGALGCRRRPQAGAALPDDRLSPVRRSAISRGHDLRPQVQPQRRPAPGRRRPRRPVGHGRRLGRQEGQARLRGRQGIRRRAGRRHQPRPRPGRPGRTRQGRARLQHGRRVDRPGDAQAHRVDHGRRVQPRRRLARHRRPQQRPDRLGSGTGREFFDLRGHQAAITDVSWRLDSNVVASASEDGSVKLWEMENGGNIKSFGAHGGGAASVRFAKDGRLLTTGRDRVVRLWDQNGGKQREFEPFGDLALEAVLCHDESKVFAADWTGEIRVWDVKDGHRLANLAVNPRPIATRLEEAKRALAAAQAEADALGKQLAPVEAAVAPFNKVVVQSQAKVAAAEQTAAKQTALVQQLDQIQKAKAAAAAEALATAQAADQLAAQASGAQVIADKGIAPAAQAEKQATDALAAAKTATEKALAAKTARDPAIAAAAATLKAAATPEAAAAAAKALVSEVQKSVELIQEVAAAGNRQSAASLSLAQATAAKNAAPAMAANARLSVKAAGLAVQSAHETTNRAAQDQAAADKALADARAALQVATTALADFKKEHAQASAAKAGAEKAIAEKKAPLEASLAKVRALKAELEALAVESRKFAPPPSKDGLASAATTPAK